MKFLPLLILSFHSALALIQCNETASAPLRICKKNPSYDPGDVHERPMNISLHSITLFSVAKFNEDLGTIAMNILLSVTWEDPRLSLTTDSADKVVEDGSYYEMTLKDADEVFFPTMKIRRVNQIDRERKFGPTNADYFWYQHPSMLEYQQSLNVKFYCTMVFGNFPFDSHHCLFSYGDSGKGIHKIRLGPPKIRNQDKSVIFGDKPLLLDQSSLPFDIKLESLESIIYREAGFDYSYAQIMIHFKRNSLGLLTGGFYGPTLIFTCLSLISFSIDPDIVPGRLGLLITLYLIASNVYGSVKAPAKRGFSYLEIWMMGVHIPMLVAIFEYGILLAIKKYWKIEKQDAIKLCQKVDMITFAASLSFIILFNIVYWTCTAFLE